MGKNGIAANTTLVTSIILLTKKYFKPKPFVRSLHVTTTAIRAGI